MSSAAVVLSRALYNTTDEQDGDDTGCDTVCSEQYSPETLLGLGWGKRCSWQAIKDTDSARHDVTPVETDPVILQGFLHTIVEVNSCYEEHPGDERECLMIARNHRLQWPANLMDIYLDRKQTKDTTEYQGRSKRGRKENTTFKAGKIGNDYDLMKNGLQIARGNEELEVLTFDTQYILPLPKIPTNMFYKRQLWVYNCGIHTGPKGKGYFYVWLEGKAGRGSQEVGSCINTHITNCLKANVKELILLWLGSFGGQKCNIGCTTEDRSGKEALFQQLQPLWPTGKPISDAKLADIKSILHLILHDASDFIKTLLLKKLFKMMFMVSMEA
ncbi:hypothetical protein PR048_027603 [Dryococelus australis]|uniref:Uncharacterized protein n=1 Tax=Dryococelus australis TaxID=614101 RepID=A0ABQ9GH12_9NEOP|nr:hypothetical protein PR048_027603 [Dryococelus australis]